MALFSVQFSALFFLFLVSILIWTLTECFTAYFKYFCNFSIKSIRIWHFYSKFSTPAIFLDEMEPMFVIHNISKATDDNIIQFGDDVNIYPVCLSREIIIWGNCLNWLEKAIVSDYIFCQFLVSWFGNSLMATECMSGRARLEITVHTTIRVSATSVFVSRVNCVHLLNSPGLHLSVFGTETLSSDKRSIDISGTL